MCVIDEHPLAGGDIQNRAPNSRSRLLSTCVLLPKKILQYPVNTVRSINFWMERPKDPNKYYLQYPVNTILEENKRPFEGLIASHVNDSTPIWNAVFV